MPFSKINFIIVATTVNLVPSQFENFLGQTVERKNKYDNSAAIKIKSGKVKCENVKKCN